MAKIEIEIDIHGRGSIKIDGEPLPDVTRIVCDLSCKEIPKVVVEMLATDGVEVHLDEAQSEIKKRCVYCGQYICQEAKPTS